MGVRVAYGEKERITNAIRNGTIPKDSIIIAKDSPESSADAELFFYDQNSELTAISRRNRFVTFTEAEQWIEKYPCTGQIITVHNGTGWQAYIVSEDKKLMPIVSDTTDVTDIKRIDGGNAAQTQ